MMRASIRVFTAALLWFGCLRAAAVVPTPESHFHHAIGVDRELLDWDQVVSYFKKLADSSPAIQVEEVGKTAEGRPFIAATISAPENLKHLKKYQEIQHKLADARITSPEEAERLIPEAKNIVLITCSIHATEVASTHTAVEFAYKLVTDQSAKYKDIRKNTIVVLMPSINPDGVDIVTRWYRKTLGTPFEGTSPPELYHHYVGHDNNRDWYTFSQPETRNVIKVYNRWLPEILYDVHQQGPTASRIFVPPWLDPIEPNVDAIIAQEMNMLGTAVATDLTASGKVGVAINAAYDFWSPARHYQAFHGGLRILTESASANLASPITLKASELDTHPLGYNAQERSWNYLEPWPGGTWRLRDIVDYQETAFESVLHNAAVRREDMARNFYRVSQRAVARTEPYAFLIPAKQRDPGATRHLLELLSFGAVEIEKNANGDHVIRMQQPYSSWAKALLERQKYPDLRMYPGGPPKRPYDTTAETLPLLFGVDVQTVKTPMQEALSKETFTLGAPFSEDLSASDTDTWKTVTALWKAGRPVWRNEQSGDFSKEEKGAGWRKVTRPRIALYRSYQPAMDEGWTRWLLEDFGFAFENVTNADLQRGNLRDRYDVLLFPDQTASSITQGYRPGTMPEQYVGGVGEKGTEALKLFAKTGGTVLCFNHSASYCINGLGVDATDVLAGKVAGAGGDESRGGRGGREPAARGGTSGNFYSPGSLLNVKLDLSSPLTKGLPENITVWGEQSPAFEKSESSVASYPDKDVLASGWLLGENLIEGKSALIDARTGEGHIILFGMRPQYRAQSLQTFKLFFNALIAYNDKTSKAGT